MGQTPRKIPLYAGNVHVCLSPPKSSTQTESRSVQPFLQGSRSWQTDRQTMLLCL